MKRSNVCSAERGRRILRQSLGSVAQCVAAVMVNMKRY